jgi:cell envelope opacity-associated protein A
MATPEAINDDTQASNRLSERLRNGLALAQTRIHTVETRAKNQWADLPTQLRGVVDRAVARLRTTLDLPSRSDVSELVERLEALDRKIAALEKRQAKRAAGAENAAAASEAAAPVAAAPAEAGASMELEAKVEASPETKIEAEASPEAKSEAKGEAKSEVKPEVGAEGNATARKTVKPNSAGKTVKAGGNAGRAADNKRHGKRKKGHGGQRS